ncbi:MAG: hypothetical protein EHM70_11565 [Chloroflexota bacterium]|nr:MAG: hypothetical protein EHM70_11565 [Chloroflexota bacterium]
MIKKKISVKIIILLLALVVVVLSGVRNVFASRQASIENEIAIQVFYKLDPRLTGGVHMGVRWVSPPLYNIISEEGSYTIVSRVEGISALGEWNVIASEWESTNPALVTVTPLYDNMVAIQIRGQGTATLNVSAAGFNQTLYVASAYLASQCTNLEVMVSQTSQPELPAQTCHLMLPLIRGR